MNTELKNAVASTDKDVQYHASAKRLLGQKSILAHILVKTVYEFMEMNPKDVVPLIEGDPYISAVPVEPGLTNIVTENTKERLIGLNGENAEILDNDDSIPTRGRGNYESDEAKENARLRRELRDAQDVLEILKKAISILGD